MPPILDMPNASEKSCSETCAEKIRPRLSRLSDHRSVNLNRHRFCEQFHGEHQTHLVFFAHQNAFDTGKRSCLDPDPIATFEERMGLGVQKALDHATHILNLCLRDHRRLARNVYDLTNAWRHANLKPAVSTSPNENGGRKERKRNGFGSVLPSMQRSIYQKEDFKPFAGENFRHCLFMLVTRIDRVPR